MQLSKNPFNRVAYDCHGKYTIQVANFVHMYPLDQMSSENQSYLILGLATRGHNRKPSCTVSEHQS
jgi:hypothetical protein